MTPNEKAKELIKKFSDIYQAEELAKIHALVCVDEIIDVVYDGYVSREQEVKLHYWREVKETLRSM